MASLVANYIEMDIISHNQVYSWKNGFTYYEFYAECFAMLLFQHLLELFLE